MFVSGNAIWFSDILVRNTLFRTRRRFVPVLRKNGEILCVGNRHQPFYIIATVQITAVMVIAAEIEFPALRAVLR